MAFIQVVLGSYFLLLYGYCEWVLMEGGYCGTYKNGLTFKKYATSVCYKIFVQ